MVPSPEGSRDTQKKTEILATRERTSWSGQGRHRAQDCCPRGGLEERSATAAGKRGRGDFSDKLSETTLSARPPARPEAGWQPD